MERFEVHTDGTTKTLTVLQGNALPQREPNAVDIIGNIDAITSYLKQRSSLINQHNSYVLVKRDDLGIILIMDEKDFYGDRIQAKLTISKEFQKFGINTGTEKTTFQLADFFKMNRSYFILPSEAMTLVNELQNFKAKVNKEIEKADDKRANTTEFKRQVATSNIPENFKLNLPLFKGEPKITIEVEVYINPDSFACSLISPMAEEFIQCQSNIIIDAEIKKIKELCPNLAIIEA